MATDRIVLDTNVCLDLFVFDDPRVLDLREALQQGRIEAVTDTACRDEWRRVLGYPQWKLDEAAQAQRLARFDAWVRPIPDRGEDRDGSAGIDRIELPRCRDPDDQKFLELALRSGARWLLSRDHHLLSMNRRMQRAGWFCVLTPQGWSHWDAVGGQPARA